MPKVEVSKSSNPLTAYKRLKRVADKLGLRKTKGNRHVKDAVQRRMDKNAAIKREKRRVQRMSLSFILAQAKKRRRRA